MEDREQIMARLEELTWADWRKHHSDSEVRLIAQDALAMLEEQEPMLVLYQRECETMPNHYERKGFCPKCHQALEWYLNRSYCGFCGQAVKWNELEK